MSDAAASQNAMRAISASAASSASVAWSRVEPERVTASWTAQLPSAVVKLTAAQAAAAALAEPLVSSTAGVAASTVNVAAFAGQASDGRPLMSLLFQPALSVLYLLSRGVSKGRALASGRASLDMMVRTQVSDAYRNASSVAMAANSNIAGYERMVRLPACGRCIVLAGRLYRWSTGFQRHPRCDCTMRPVTGKQWRESSLHNHPRALFDQMSPAQQDDRFGKANAAAIRDGADISKVVNARRGMATAGNKGARPMPEQIYKMASNRAEAVKLLRRYGYIL